MRRLIPPRAEVGRFDKYDYMFMALLVIFLLVVVLWQVG